MVRWEDWIGDNGQPRYGSPLGILLSAHAAATPGSPAWSMGDVTYDFATFDRMANRRARALTAWGISHGDKVVLSMPNRHEYIECAYALWKIGAIQCPVSERLVPAEFEAIVSLAEASCVIGTSALPPTNSRLYDVDRESTEGFDDTPLPPVTVTPGKIANSGGSTGRPKLIIDPNPSTYAQDKEGYDRGPRMVYLNPGPFYHVATFNTAVFAMAQGSHIVCLERWDPHAWLAAVERHKVSYVYLAPIMMSRIAKLPEAETRDVDLSSIAMMYHTSAPCPPDIKRWWLDRIGPEKIWEVYGGTERVGVTRILGTEWLAHPGSVGKASPGQEIIITDEEGRQLPPGEVGDIYFRKAIGVGTSYKYIGSDTRIRGDTDSFGDMGWLDEDGYLYIADRRTDMIVVGGINVYPAELEAAVEAMPDVRCCAIIGLPEADIGNRLHAIVEYASADLFPADEGAFLEAVGANLSPHKRPRSVEFTTTPVRNDAGKVRRSQLRAERLAAMEKA